MDIENKKVLVLGGSGFIGGHVVDALLVAGAKVTVIDRSGSDHMAVETLALDISSSGFVDFLGERSFDFMLHFAGPASVPESVENPYVNFEEIAHSSVRLLELLRTVCPETRFIFTSSAAVYGNPVHLPMCESDPTVPISPYGVAKLAVERYCAVYSQLYGLSVASLRPFSIYGPGQRNLLVYDLIRKLTANPQSLEMFGSGTESRDFIFVKDVARAILRVMEQGLLQGEAYNIASGRTHTTLQVARIIADVLGVDPVISFSGAGRSGDPLNWCADIERLSSLGFIPRFDMQQGIEETVAWYMDHVK